MAISLQPPDATPLPGGVALAPQRPSPGARLLHTLTLGLAWHERARQRRALMELDDRALADIGISRADAERECRNPFWWSFRPLALRTERNR